jgi:hypothetical protein
MTGLRHVHFAAPIESYTFFTFFARLWKGLRFFRSRPASQSPNLSDRSDHWSEAAAIMTRAKWRE